MSVRERLPDPDFGLAESIPETGQFRAWMYLRRIYSETSVQSTLPPGFWLPPSFEFALLVDPYEHNALSRRFGNAGLVCVMHSATAGATTPLVIR